MSKPSSVRSFARRLVFPLAILVLVALEFDLVKGVFAVIVSVISIGLTVAILADTKRIIVEGRAHRQEIRAQISAIEAWTSSLNAGSIGLWPDWQGRTEAQAEAEDRAAGKKEAPELVAARARLAAAQAEGKALKAQALSRLVDAQVERILVVQANLD